MRQLFYNYGKSMNKVSVLGIELRDLGVQAI